MRVQFPIRTLLLVTVVFALLSLIARWLIAQGFATALGVVSALGVGLLVGATLCLLNQHVTVGKPLVNTALVMLVAACAWWFANYFGSYMLGVVLGTISVSQRAALLSYLCRLLGFSVTTNDQQR